MAQQKKDEWNNLNLHHYYMGIINCMPDIVYWIDLDCLLKGCNKQFAKLLGSQQTNDFIDTPYEQMAKGSTWTLERIEALKLDDMAVLFSGQAKHGIEEAPIFNQNGEATYYRANRVPLLDENKRVMGLVVILTDITEQKKLQKCLIQDELVAESMSAKCLSNRLRVLIVEDNMIAQRIEKTLLEALNCDVDIAASGEAATQLFFPGKYAIVFMDIGLADTSGYVVSKTFRKMEKDTPHHVTIIALTSYQADVVKYDCNDYLMNGVITKPLTSEQAMQIIKHYVYQQDVEVEGLVTV